MNRGRPREVEDPVKVTVLIPAGVYDDLYRQAREAGHGSIARVIRGRISAPQNHEPLKPVHTEN